MAFQGVIRPSGVSTSLKAKDSPLWGTFRSNLYFGTRPKTQSPILTGLLWHPRELGLAFSRHSCELSDDIASYGWKMHDGRNFGHQIINDDKSNMLLDIFFLQDSEKHDWTVRFEGKKLRPSEKMDIKFMYYVASEQTQTIKKEGIFGFHPEIGKYKVEAYSAQSDTAFKGIKVPSHDLWKVKEFLQDEFTDIPDNCNISIMENVFNNDFALEISFVHSESRFFPFAKEVFHQKSMEFNKKFSRSFQISPLEEFDQLAKFALSNLLGGIGYFYGSSMISSDSQDARNNYIVTPEYSLFTDIPSRSVFPRGFLWDTGFHNLIICQWDVDLSLEILLGWLSLINQEGWIGREQIIGEEARSKVPKDLIAQNPNYGNPPALLLPLMKIIQNNSISNDQLKFILEKLEANFSWFRKTQRTFFIPKNFQNNSNLALFQWKGRTMHHTLTSGLDDYPRGAIPREGEVHLDLLCWMAFMADCLAKLNEKVGLSTCAYSKAKDAILQTIHQISFDSDSGLFYDAYLEEGKDEKDVIGGRVVHVKHRGYINVFPFIFLFLSSGSRELNSSLDLIEKDLWSPYGIMSLCKNDEYYGKGDNYWTGPVWININYMILRALYMHYIPQSSQASERIRLQSLYQRLRKALMQNMLSQYRKTGHIWEQYNPETGHGQRAHPFTGWSSLVLLIIGEKY